MGVDLLPGDVLFLWRLAFAPPGDLQADRGSGRRRAMRADIGGLVAEAGRRKAGGVNYFGQDVRHCRPALPGYFPEPELLVVLAIVFGLGVLIGIAA